MATYTNEDHWSHRAGVRKVQPLKPPPTALDRLQEIMRADYRLSRKTAERLVMERFPEHQGAFTVRD